MIMLYERSFVHSKPTYVRPLLEYGTPVWSPHHSYKSIKYKVFKDRLQSVWVVCKLWNTYWSISQLGIDSLEQRRLNLMLCYKLWNNLCNSSISNLFKPGYAVSRDNGFKLAKLSSNVDINKYCYHNRVVDIRQGRYVLLKAGSVIIIIIIIITLLIPQTVNNNNIINDLVCTVRSQ